MRLKPTKEQENIISVAPTMKEGQILKISAFAGAAKTTTLRMIAEAMPEKRFLYLAFNKAIVEENKGVFPNNVTIMTTHSLAFRHAAKGKKINNNYRAAEISKKFKVIYQTAEMALRALEFYFNSDLLSIKSVEVDGEAKKVASSILDAMRSGEMDITHSFYLKEFQLMLMAGYKPSLEFDYILLDEAQDTNPVTLSIFGNMGGKGIIVGDKHQQIYGFRLSHNAMAQIEGKELHLSVTFRCIPEIVRKANWILHTFKGEESKIISGNASKPEFRTYAYISRTNSQLIHYIAKHDKFNLTRTPEAIFDCALSVYNWDKKDYAKVGNSFKFLLDFDTKDKLREYIEATQDFELSKALDIVEQYKEDLLNLFDKAKRNHALNGRAILTLTTAHSAKGLEFDKVQLGDDFPDIMDLISELIAEDYIANLKEFYTDDNKDVQSAREEVNLYYVACTRAKFELQDMTSNADKSDESVADIAKAIHTSALIKKELMNELGKNK